MMSSTIIALSLLLVGIHRTIGGTTTINNGELEYSDSTGVYYDQLPGDIPDNVNIILLIGNQLTSLETCPVLGELTRLDLSDNKLTSFPNLLSVSSELSVLILKKNKITQVDPERLNVLTKLKVSNVY